MRFDHIMFVLEKYYESILRTIELMHVEADIWYVYLNEFCHMCMSKRRDEYEKPEGISESSMVNANVQGKAVKSNGPLNLLITSSPIDACKTAVFLGKGCHPYLFIH